MSTGNWQPIVVGVDTSPAATEAVRVGWAIADRAGTTCSLVHATPEAWTLPNTAYVSAGQPEMLNDAVREAARTAVRETLSGDVPDAALYLMHPMIICWQPKKPSICKRRMAKR